MYTIQTYLYTIRCVQFNAGWYKIMGNVKIARGSVYPKFINGTLFAAGYPIPSVIPNSVQEFFDKYKIIFGD